MTAPFKSLIFKNALFHKVEENPGSEEFAYLRILWISPNRDYMFLISVPTKGMTPFELGLEEFENMLKEGQLVPCTSDPFILLGVSLTNKQISLRDRRWDIIRPLVDEPEGKIFDSSKRGAQIQERSDLAGVGRNHIWAYLRAYWQGGQCPNALLPRFDRCGGRGVSKSSDREKMGRKSRLGQRNSELAGISITVEDVDNILTGARLFHENQRMPLRRAYKRTLFAYYTRPVVEDGEVRPVLPPATELPTFRQFQYHYHKARDLSEALKKRVGKRKFNLRHRVAIHSSLEHLRGPGSSYQVDSTIGDLYLRSARVSDRLVGRPVIYFVGDAYSDMITGFGVSLQGPSWETLMLALENSFTDKVAFCRKFGITIDEAQWPCRHIPASIKGDRGELLSKHGDQLTLAFGTTIDNTAAWRPDWKAVVERLFGTLDDDTIEWMPGAIHDLSDRGSPDYRLDATLNCYQFVQVMIQFILKHNNTRQIKDDGRLPQGFPYPAMGNPTPIDLWNWGVENRSGYLSIRDADSIRANLLPGATASIHDRGLYFRGLYYAPSPLLDNRSDDPQRSEFENWFLRNTGRVRPSVDICFDPRDVAVLYIRMDNGRTIVPCGLLRGFKHFAGLTHDEYADLKAIKAMNNQLYFSQALSDEHHFEQQINDIVQNAKKEVLGIPVIASDIRKTRKEEATGLRKEDAWRSDTHGTVHAPPPVTPDMRTDKQTYKPAPSNLDILIRARNKQPKGKDEK